MRPLLTIGPTAIRFGVPINTQLPYNDPGLLADTLLAPEYRSATIYVAWEHLSIVEFTEILLTRFRNASSVPAWDNDDYDKVFVFTVRLERSADARAGDPLRRTRSDRRRLRSDTGAMSAIESRRHHGRGRKILRANGRRRGAEPPPHAMPQQIRALRNWRQPRLRS